MDRTSGSNPIRQDLDNLKDAGTLYGNIIYHKAPVMMRQLERLMGEEKFQRGVQEYLKKFANGNASWPELISILDKYTDEDLQAWNKVWVNDVGRPVVDYKVEEERGKISAFTITQHPEYGSHRLWPQWVEVKFFYPGRTEEFSVNLNAETVQLPQAKGLDKPLFVLFNSSGQGYGLWPVDKEMFDRIYAIEKPLNRASAYITLYENMLTGRFISPVALLDLLMKGLQKETEELNLKLITGYIGTIYWEFLSAADRVAASASLERTLWLALSEHGQANHKKLLFKSYQDIFASAEARDRLYRIWHTQAPPDGLKLTEDDYTTLAFSLALRGDADKDLLKKQLARISNPDRRTRFEFIMPAVSASVAERDAFFESLQQRANRGKEANVVAALYYLHHPLRQQTSAKYLRKSLEMLVEIQTTGDIFFPQNWLQAIFSYYQHAEAADTVRSFLDENPDYNPKLKAKILQAADHVFKAEKLLRKD
ncbi:M1 family aminopeptidase [Pedobacter deserti]|uniref:M1 family aminopeptidase n=1 Tax=Pedobacter deserti TaxID=2817382 RepID=UPI00210B7973